MSSLEFVRAFLKQETVIFQSEHECPIFCYALYLNFYLILWRCYEAVFQCLTYYNKSLEHRIFDAFYRFQKSEILFSIELFENVYPKSVQCKCYALYFTLRMCLRKKKALEDYLFALPIHSCLQFSGSV